MAQLEAVCDRFYNPSSEEDRRLANQQLMALGLQVAQCQHILEHSHNQYALMVSASCLVDLAVVNVGDSWSDAESGELRDQLVAYLFARGPQLPKSVSAVLCKAAVVVTKRGWAFGSSSSAEVAKSVGAKCFGGSVEQTVLALSFLKELVHGMMDSSLALSSAQHYRSASIFRILHLSNVFKVVHEVLLQLQSTPAEARPTVVLEMALEMCTRCLGFSTHGFARDDEAIPSAIDLPRGLQSQVEAGEGQLLELLWSFGEAHPLLVLEAVLPLSCVRFFSRPNVRQLHASKLLKGVRWMLSDPRVLAEPDIHHRVCLLVASTMSNYRVTEVFAAAEALEGGAAAFFEQLAHFSGLSFGRWELMQGSSHYLLVAWSELMGVMREVEPASAAVVMQALPQLVECYLKGCLDSVEPVLEGVADPMLEDTMWGQLEYLPLLCRYVYASIGPALASLMDSMLAHYASSLGSEPSKQRKILEGQLAWMVNAIGAIIGGHYSLASSRPSGYSNGRGPQAIDQMIKPGDELLDADLARRVLQLLQPLATAQPRCLPQLEVAVVYFLSNLKYAVLYCDQAERDPGGYVPGRGRRVPGGSGMAGSMPEEMQQSIEQRLGLGDNVSLMRMVAEKLIHNLSAWADTPPVLDRTVELFLDLAAGDRSGKLLLECDVVQWLLKSHAELPFLQQLSARRQRTVFYSALVCLLVHQWGDGQPLMAFMQPLVTTLKQIASSSDAELQSAQASNAVINVACDLRGIIEAATSSQIYQVVFEALQQGSTPGAQGTAVAAFARACEVHYTDPNVTKAVLHFLVELVYDGLNRITFNQHSDSGLRLFKDVCATITPLCRKLTALDTNSLPDPYTHKFKAARLCFDVIGSVVEGKYVNFGVMDLYGDRTLHTTLDTVFRLACTIPSSELMKYVKLGVAYYHLVESLFRNYLTGAIALQQDLFVRLLASVQDGIVASSDVRFLILSASSVDQLASFVFENARRPSAQMTALRAHLDASPDMLSAFLETLFNKLTFDDQCELVPISQAILTISLADQEAFRTVSQRIGAQVPQHTQAVAEAFGALMQGVPLSLGAQEREAFVVRAEAFRREMRGICGLTSALNAADPML